MQPNNQAGVPPQAPQPRPVSAAPVSPQPAAPLVNDRGERVIQPLVQQQPAAPQVQPAAQQVPQQVPRPQPVAAPAPVQSPQAVPQPAPAQQPVAPVAPEALGAAAVEAQVQNSYEFADASDDEGYEEGEIDLSEPVAWQAAEFIHHERPVLWYVISAVVLLALVAFSVYMKAYTFTAVLLFIAVVIGIYTRRPPHTINYALSEEGLSIDNALHRYEEFKSFGIIRDGEEFSVMLIPRKRFQPGITVYFPEEAGEDIVDVLGSRLPMRDLKLDVVDKIVRKLRL